MDVDMVDSATEQELKRNVRGRGAKDTMVDDRYSGRGGIFDSLTEDDSAAAEKDAGKPLKSIEGWILIVTGVHEECAEDDLYSSFEEFGTIKNLHLNLDRRTGYVKGYALLEYETYNAARAAIDGMNNREVYGMKVSVNWAFRKSDAPLNPRKKA